MIQNPERHDHPSSSSGIPGVLVQISGGEVGRNEGNGSADDTGAASMAVRGS